MRYNVIDSRSVFVPKETTFYAIRTATGDGHDFISHLYDKGVRDFVIDRDVPFLDDKSDASVTKVKSVTKELQHRAAEYRSSLKNTTFIAITGSRGKTIVKEWLYTLLSPQADRSPRSYNSQLGVPLSILSIAPDAKYAIIEAGISQPGEMDVLREIIRPDIVILTNVTGEHSDAFTSHKEQVKEKLRLALDAKTLIYTPGYADVDGFVKELTNTECVKANTCALQQRNGIYEHFLNGNSYEIDRKNLDSVLMAAQVLGVKVTESQIATLNPIKTRIDVIEGVNGCTILYDTFTNDIKSLIPALDFASRRLKEGQKLSLIINCKDDKYKDEIFANEIVKAGFENIGLSIDLVHEGGDTTKEISTARYKDAVILIKGSPGSGMERIVSLLEKKQHETVMEVNLDNVVHNYNFFRSKLRRDTGVICMLKAAGYGTGSLALARTLQSQGAAAIAVAVIDEGVELRKAGITMPILVLNPRADNLRIMFEYQLEPEVYNIEILGEILKAAQESNLSNYPVHIKLDTGMHRLGFNESTLPQAIAILTSQTALKVSSTFSHLATADCPDMNEYTENQLKTFETMVAVLRNSLPYSIKCHILNTAGILRYPKYQHELVRLGIGLYGIPVLNDGSETELRPVAALYSTIIEISDRMPGDTIGYSRRGKITRQSRIATIPIGYADGLDRHLGCGNAKFYINGKLCPTIGNICMDICMVDVTDCNCKIGDRVEIFGEHIPITTLSDTLGTIPYEILTSISERVKRIYYRE